MKKSRVSSRRSRSKRSRSKRSRSKRSRSKRSRSKPTKKEIMNNVLDRKKLLSETPKSVRSKLSVTLKKNKYAGTGLFATKNIKKGAVIAYYKMKLYKDTVNSPYKSPTKCMYCFTVYTKNGNMHKTLIGDLDTESAPQPKNNIPYWGYFANEPSGKQKENCEIDVNLSGNYKSKSRLKEGDFITYKLIASHNIKAGEEIVWCYGESYARNYETSCN